MKYGFGIKIIPDQSLAFLQYKFTDFTLQCICKKNGWFDATFPEAGGTGFICSDIHGRIAAYVNQGLVSLKRKWQMKYGFGIKIIPDQSLALIFSLLTR